MKNFWKNLPFILLILFVTLYGSYYSLFTIKRYEKMYAHYFDLGIMHQTVYNTYKGIQTGDFSRILELTNPHQKPNQIKRMAIHNDILLAFLVPFYFIHAGPETLLVLQSVILALGGIFVFFIAKEVLQKLPYVNWIALTFAPSYLLYYPLGKSNTYEFHAVTLATTFLLGMYYAFLKKRYGWSTVFAILSIFSKEQVGLTVALFGGFILFEEYRKNYKKVFSVQNIKKYINEVLKTYQKNQLHTFALTIIFVSILWVLLTMILIIPFFRGEEHFASQYFNYIKENPLLILYALVQPERIRYLQELLSPLAFLSIFSPLHLLIALPDLLINLLASNGAMRNTYFHYTAVITPFVFISAIYGFKNLTILLSRVKNFKTETTVIAITCILLITTFNSAYLYGRLPYSKNPDLYPWQPGREKIEDVLYWKEKLEDDSIKVATTGQIAPFFTSRRYFYDFTYTYPNADYIVVDRRDVQYGFMKTYSYPAYLDLQNDQKYIRIYNRNEIEVYKKI